MSGWCSSSAHSQFTINNPLLLGSDLHICGHFHAQKGDVVAMALSQRDDKALKQNRTATFIIHSTLRVVPGIACIFTYVAT